MPTIFFKKAGVVGESLKIISQGLGLKDYTSVTTGSTEDSYGIGTQAKAANPKIQAFPPAYSVMLYATTDTYVRFNDNKNVQVFIPADIFLSFDGPIWRIYHQQVNVAGTLYIWSEA